MARDRWHIDVEGDKLTLSRAPLARFDFAVQARFLDVSRLRLAQQIRQDMWRRLQFLRGFSPVVVVQRSEDGLSVTAGGQVSAHPFSKEKAENTLREMLECSELRQRWLRFAALRKAAA